MAGQYIGFILGVYRGLGFRVRVGLYWGYVRLMENKIETTIILPQQTRSVMPMELVEAAEVVATWTRQNTCCLRVAYQCCRCKRSWLLIGASLNNSTKQTRLAVVRILHTCSQALVAPLHRAVLTAQVPVGKAPTAHCQAPSLQREPKFSERSMQRT